MSGSRRVLDLVPGLRELALAQQQVVSRLQLRELGIGSDDVAAQVRAQRWRTIGHAVVVLHRGGISREGQFWVALLHAGPAALVAWTALEWYGMQRWERRDVHVIVARGTSVTPLPGLVVHESRRFRMERDAVQWRGLTTVRRPRAVLDAASWEKRPDTGAALLAAAVQQRLVGVDRLAAELATAGQIRHARLLREHLVAVSRGTDSLGEIRIASILRDAGLPSPRRQTPIRVAGVRRRMDVEVDLPDGSVLVLEIDGVDHDDLRARATDTLKDLAAVTTARLPVRVTPWMVRHRRDQLVAALRGVRDAAAARAEG